jgi:hypothetical protein
MRTPRTREAIPLYYLPFSVRNLLETAAITIVIIIFDTHAIRWWAALAGHVICNINIYTLRSAAATTCWRSCNRSSGRSATGLRRHTIAPASSLDQRPSRGQHELAAATATEQEPTLPNGDSHVRAVADSLQDRTEPAHGRGEVVGQLGRAAVLVLHGLIRRARDLGEIKRRTGSRRLRTQVLVLDAIHEAARMLIWPRRPTTMVELKAMMTDYERRGSGPSVRTTSRPRRPRSHFRDLTGAPTYRGRRQINSRGLAWPREFICAANRGFDETSPMGWHPLLVAPKCHRRRVQLARLTRS